MNDRASPPPEPPAGIRRLQAAQLRLAAVALLTMMTGTVLDVFFRYAFNKPLRISYDLVESMLVIYVFHGISSVFLARRNIVIDVIDSLVGPRILRVLAVIADIVSVMCLLLFMWGMLQPAMQAFQWRSQAGTGPAALCAVGFRAGGALRHPPLRRCRPCQDFAAPVTEPTVSPGTIGSVGIVSLLLLLFLRIPVWAALALVGFAGNVVLSGLPGALTLTGTSAFDVSSAYTLSVIPLFVLLGEVASHTRLSADLFNAARLLLSGVRGGLAIATILASACFGAVCGSSIVTAATMTRIALPEMRKAGYDPGLASGSLAAGGSLGI